VNAVVSSWLSSEAVSDWSGIQPPIGTVDLRPYLFIAKDRKDYFGATTVLGQLVTVAEQLFGPKLIVQRLEHELKRLAHPEAVEVLELVRRRIMNTDSLGAAPAGVDGLSVLVKAQPNLQRNLLDFLETLPVDRLGPWAVTGWQGVIKEPEMDAPFQGLLEIWASSGNAPLKVAAEGVLKIRKGTR
jgi:hypothetical protein